jgi:hypothetical protein
MSRLKNPAIWIGLGVLTWVTGKYAERYGLPAQNDYVGWSDGRKGHYLEAFSSGAREVSNV